MEENGYVLHNEGIPVLGDQWLPLAIARELSGPVKVTLRNGTILERSRREQRVGESVLLNETVRYDPEDLCPHFTNGVYAPVAGLVKRLVG